MTTDRKQLAERFLRGVYCGDPTVVDELASEDIVSSYPVFESLFNTSAIRGRESVKAFAVGFSQRWIEPQIVIHEAIADGDRVVLLWSFQARNIGPGQDGAPATNQLHRWGGLTLIQFNQAGQIVADIGEESSPGPFERLSL